MRRLDTLSGVVAFARAATSAINERRSMVSSKMKPARDGSYKSVFCVAATTRKEIEPSAPLFRVTYGAIARIDCRHHLQYN